MDRQAAALTGDSGAVALRVRHHQFVLQAAAAHPLGTNQDQRLPPEGRDLGHLLVYPQLVAVELWAGNERAAPLSDSLTRRGVAGTARAALPAFLVVKYIIFFFFLPPMPAHRGPAAGRTTR